MKTIRISDHRSRPLFSDSGENRKNTTKGLIPRGVPLHIPSDRVHLDRAEQPAEATTHMQKCSLVSFLHQFSKPGAAKHAAGVSAAL